MYDPFFSHPRPYNKVIQKVLYSDEILKNYGRLAVFSQQPSIQMPEKQLTYNNDMKLPPVSYEQYKKMNTNTQVKDNRSGSATHGGQRQIQSASNKEREKSMGLQGVSQGLANAMKDQKNSTP